MNGQNGASSFATVTRQSRSVAKAAGSPSQKRRRERRTYQLESSSTNAWMARPARRWRRSRPGARATDLDGRLQPRQDPAVQIVVAPRSAPPGRARSRSRWRRGRRSAYVFHSCSRNWRTASPIVVEREAVAVPRLLGGEEVPAQRVGAVAVDDLPRLDRVARATWTSCGPARRGSARGRRRSGTTSGRTAASRRPAASRTSRASGRAPRR